MRTIIYIILGTLGGIAIAYAALVLWFSFWMGNHIQDQLDSLGDGINAHFEAQDAKYTAYEMDFFHKFIFRVFENNTAEDVLEYLQTTNFEFDLSINEDGTYFLVVNGPLVKTYRNFEHYSWMVFRYDHGHNLSEIEIPRALKFALPFFEDETSLPEGITRVTKEIEHDTNLLRTVALSKLRGQPYDDISQLIDAAGFDMIQKTDRIHVFMSAVRSVDFIFIDGTLSHITNNCAQAPETCHRQED